LNDHREANKWKLIVDNEEAQDEVTQDEIADENAVMVFLLLIFEFQ
jgi:hypothetical protein